MKRHGKTVDVRPFRRKLLRWYRDNGRDLPWRRTRNPYRIFVSEVMLQQTQVSRVVAKYRELIRAFPTVSALARASRGRVLRLWQGMGYNNRAIRLHEASRIIVKSFGGRIPAEYAALRSLPGIGDNTARAILCFAFDRSEPVMDVNVNRVLSRVFRKSASDITPGFAQEVMPRRDAYDWNQALMDLGAVYCTASGPDCAHCPVSSECRSAFQVRRSAAQRRPEPSRHGIPRRIYRGRILKVVTQSSSMRPRSLAQAVGLRDNKTDMIWLKRVVETLAREGLLNLRNGGSGWSVQRIP